MAYWDHVYTWDSERRDNTFKACIDALNRAKGLGIEFDWVKPKPDSKSLWLGINGKYVVHFWLEDLAKAGGKAGQDADFEKLTDEQYLALCKYAMEKIWKVAKMLLA